MMYTEEYYTTKNYKGYLNKESRYKKTAQDISKLLTDLRLLSNTSKVLDFGCAVGFLTKALSDLGYSTFGYDISAWAIKEAKKNNVNVVKDYEGHYDVVFALDVLEHMVDTEIEELFNKCKSKVYVLRIPCAENDGNDFYLEVSRNDPTHINCKTREDWISYINILTNGNILFLDTYTIYDSPGVLCCLVITSD